MLSMERAEKLTNYLKADPDRARELFEMEPKNALVAINASGYDFTIEELEAYCAAFKEAVLHNSADGEELSIEEMENVAGGVVLTGGMVLGLIGCFAGGAVIGIAAGAKW